jgi:hypothetical protein
MIYWEIQCHKPPNLEKSDPEIWWGWNWHRALTPCAKGVFFVASRINLMAQRNTFLNGEIQIWTIWENRTSDNLTPQMWCLRGKAS